MDNLFANVMNGQFTIKTYIICTVAAFVCGIIIAFCANVKNRSSKSFTTCLILLPAIVETVILMVNGNVGTGIAVAGAFSLVRFRSVPGKAREIAAIFLAMTAGLTCASGYISVALVFTVAVSAAMILISLIPMSCDKEYDLRITVPETINFEGAFDEVFEKYTKQCRLFDVKTSNMGSLYKLKYKVVFKSKVDSKAFIDDLRVCNGNLEISLCQSMAEGEVL